jgi:C-terminal processing protease CtpA/Prc
VKGFRALAETPFLAGVFPAGGRTLGVVRVTSLLAREVPPACAAPGIAADLSAALGSLRAAGAEAIVVDLVGSRGGEDLAVLLAAELLGAPPRCPRIAHMDAASPCDLAPVWRGERPACTRLATLDVPCPRPTPRAARPPGEGLVVLVDRRSGPGAELLASLLVEQGGAKLAGEPTAGAGCAGSASLPLPSLGITVEVPDCARLFASGENARAGLFPDVVLAGEEWTPAVAAALAAALE